MNFPLVSIIIPTFNQQPDYFKACIESAIGQTYPNIEIIVSDNHSNNEVPLILETYRSSNLKIVKPALHVGLTENFIFAAKAAKGEYISFLSSDDLLYPTCIEKNMALMLSNKNLSFAYCENAIIDEKGNTQFLVRNNALATGVYPKHAVALRMYNHSEYWIIGAVIKHDFYKLTRFADLIAADWVLGFKLLQYGDVGYVNETLSAIRFHERQGAAMEEYADRHITHHKQRIAKHNYIIQDKTLLAAINISEQEALNYRYHEVLLAVISLTRKFHAKQIKKAYAEEVMTLYSETENGAEFNFLVKNFTRKYALLYTYLIGFRKRIKRIFQKK